MSSEKKIVEELDEIANTTDAEAVRKVFDAHNAMWAAILATVFTLVDFALFGYGASKKSAPPLAWLIALVMLMASATMAWITTELANPKRLRHKPAKLVSRNLTQWIFGYLFLQFATFGYAGGPRSTVIWSSILPWMILGFRLSWQRRFTFLAGIAALTVVLVLQRSNIKPPEFTALGSGYALAMAVGSFNSLRVRNKTIADFSVRRASAREQVRMRDELRYARELQLSMLPDAPPDLPWADIAAISIPATEVGGDYFEYIDVDGSLAVICGDVAGHGLSSGITLSVLRGAIILLRQSLTNPAAVLERLHDVVAESSRRRTIVTMTAALFDPKSQRATIASAGHPPVLVRRQGTVESIELFGPPLGARRTERIPQREVAFERGDVFVLHSDGIYETTNEAGEQFGLDRFAKTLATSDGSAIEIRDEVLRSVEQFRGNATADDDVTLVVVKMR
ncbi:MAG TPA: SpoIIE family protein phosphatase [Thermoanaerobaculia bacterium]|nr:SpoIIE family protein phosphatase [Thermoanaerobaculia bacterium]